LVLSLAVLVLTVVIAVTRRGVFRLLALIPIATVLGILLFVAAGGIILLVTWLTAAAVDLTQSPRSMSEVWSTHAPKPSDRQP
jgi:hypothetical protein